MEIYSIERDDGLIFNSCQPGGSPPMDDQLRRKEVAVSILGGSVADWTGKETDYTPEAGKIIRLIEADGQGGYTVHQDELIKTSGMMATLSKGWFGGCVIMPEDDSHEFASSASERSLALDVVRDDTTGIIELQPYTWDHLADPPQVKSSPPAGVTVLKEDILRGILPAGADSLDQLMIEED